MSKIGELTAYLAMLGTMRVGYTAKLVPVKVHSSVQEADRKSVGTGHWHLCHSRNAHTGTSGNMYHVNGDWQEGLVEPDFEEIRGGRIEQKERCHSVDRAASGEALWAECSALEAAGSSARGRWQWTG